MRLVGERESTLEAIVFMVQWLKMKNVGKTLTFFIKVGKSLGEIELEIKANYMIAYTTVGI